MSQEPNKPKLILPLKKSLETPANQEKALPEIPAPAADTNDPITRLGNELFQLKEQVKFLAKAIQVIEKRGIPATAAQVEQLLKTVKSGLTYKIDSEQIVQSLIPYLEKHGVKTVISVQDATYEASKQMTAVYEQEAKKWNARLGFTSWQAAVGILGTVFLLLMGCTWYAATQQARITAIEANLQRSESDNAVWRDYARWIDDKNPKIRQAYVAEEKQRAKGANQGRK
jgi:anti-sigma28 factor (negative regulator of flagellin synthesis)